MNRSRVHISHRKCTIPPSVAKAASASILWFFILVVPYMKRVSLYSIIMPLGVRSGAIAQRPIRRPSCELFGTLETHIFHLEQKALLGITPVPML
jgi:hypothetical protein